MCQDQGKLAADLGLVLVFLLQKLEVEMTKHISNTSQQQGKHAKYQLNLI